MKTRSLWLICLAGLAAARLESVSAQDNNAAPLTEEDRKLFDGLQVSEEAEKAARQRLEKDPARPAAAPELPAPAVKALDRLAVYEASLAGIADEMVSQSRKK